MAVWVVLERRMEAAYHRIEMVQEQVPKHEQHKKKEKRERNLMWMMEVVEVERVVEQNEKETKEVKKKVEEKEKAKIRKAWNKNERNTRKTEEGEVAQNCKHKHWLGKTQEKTQEKTEEEEAQHAWQRWKGHRDEVRREPTGEGLGREDRQLRKSPSRQQRWRALLEWLPVWAEWDRWVGSSSWIGARRWWECAAVWAAGEARVR